MNKLSMGAVLKLLSARTPFFERTRKCSCRTEVLTTDIANEMFLAVPSVSEAFEGKNSFKVSFTLLSPSASCLKGLQD